MIILIHHDNLRLQNLSLALDRELLWKYPLGLLKQGISLNNEERYSKNPVEYKACKQVRVSSGLP